MTSQYSPNTPPPQPGKPLQEQGPYVAPPRFYWYLHLNRAGQTRASKKGNERAAAKFILQVKSGVDMLVRRDPDGDKRLAAYRAKPLELWAEQYEKFPDSGVWWDFRHCMEDWQKLAPSDPIRDAVIQGIADIELAKEQAALQPAPVSPATVGA